ncbi:MAG TPA: PD-(D/E)XK nuclease family protein [Gammaproteobacteria bacterium]
MNPATAEQMTVVTASDRLARHLHDRVADAQLAAGRQAWERPDILTAAAFWRRLAGELQQEAATVFATRRLLSRNAMLCRWEMLIAAAFADNPLLHIQGTARTALDAWLLCRDWQLDIDALADDPLEETRLLIAWGRRFEKECADAGWLPDYALPEAVLAALEQSKSARRFLPKKIQLAGFMEITPRDAARWEALRALGVTVENFPQAESGTEMRRLACNDARGEVLAAASWARALLNENPRQRIAIVVPDLAARRASLKRELTEALAPHALTSFDRAPLPFNFSLGEALASNALVADAQALLALSNDRIEFPLAARLCRSPYPAPELDAFARLRLEAIMRRNGYAEFPLGDWQFLAARNQCAVLADALEKFREDVKRDSANSLPSEWARRFNHWLEIFGWCRGRALDSDEYQAREAFQEQLARLVELDAVLGKCNRGVALAWLNRFANDTPFQPRSADVPVQVLGLLEATGMHFDALWVMGLTDDVLPSAPRPNPFLPIAVQRAKNLPQSSAAREQAFARQLFEGLCASAPNVIGSYPARDKDAELGPSPFLQELEAATPPPAFRPISEQWFDRVALETVIDNNGAAHAGGETRGGMSLLQDQSHCPFRAFAVHRLHADDWPTPQPGPDAMIRGLLAHRVLERLWMQWRDRSRLEELHVAGELEDVVRAMVTEVLEESVRGQRHRWRRSLRELEVTRLASVLMRWFENIELPRPDFRVVEVEGHRANDSDIETLVHAGPLILRGKLDRVDVLNDGSELIIDYKTGGAPAKNDFFGDRPRAPQLPAYLLARKQAGRNIPAGIAVASLKTGMESLQGVMSVDDDRTDPGIAGIVNVAKTKQVSDWNEAIEHWERTIGALGDAFASGYAKVDPLRGACDYCPLAMLCRVHDRERETEEGHD